MPYAWVIKYPLRKNVWVPFGVFLYFPARTTVLDLKSKAQKKLPAHEAAVLNINSVLIPVFNKPSCHSLEIRVLNLDPQL